MNCSFVALISGLLGLGGLAGVGHHWHSHRLPHGHHGHHGHQEHHSVVDRKQCDEGLMIIKCHRQCGHDMDCHERCPLPQCPKMAAKVKGIIQCNVDCGSDFACRDSCNRPVKQFVEMCTLHRPDFEESKPPPAQFIVSKFHTCQKECAGDAGCMEKCPKPFWIGFNKTCEEAIPIMTCHRACGHDHGCHQRCPLPSCPHMKAEVEKTMECHGQCHPEDRECHDKCPKPMKSILEKCMAFKEAQKCHSTCTDFKCHHECPKACLWKSFGHDSHYGFRHGHQGFHHAEFGAVPHADRLPMPGSMVPMLRGSMPHQGLHQDHLEEVGLPIAHGDPLREPEPADCATECQHDEQCLKKCYGTWQELRRACVEVDDIMGCHQQCGHDFVCHRNCRRPRVPWLNKRVEASLACHNECTTAECHQSCKCPFQGMKEKCAKIVAPTGVMPSVMTV